MKLNCNEAIHPERRNCAKASTNQICIFFISSSPDLIDFLMIMMMLFNTLWGKFIEIAWTIDHNYIIM